MNDAAALDNAAGAILTVDLEALRANYLWLASQAAPGRCAAVVKADAYGLGAIPVARTLQAVGCDTFFVAHLAEGAALRPHLAPTTRIFILNGLQPGAEADCHAAGLIPVLNSLDQAVAWGALAQAMRTRLPAALQVDSGMSRLGLPRYEIDAFVERSALAAPIDVCLLMSHLACADEPDHPVNAAQAASFEDLRARFPDVPASLANSGGILLGARFAYDLARPGLALYGVSPTHDARHPLRPVAGLQARVIQVRTIPSGTVVGYGATFQASHETRIATVALGYADGWPRNLGNRGAAFFRGTRLPIVGRVSMDSLTLDVSALAPETLKRGSLVEFLGPDQTLDDVADQSGTIPYEILTRLGHRFARRFVGEDGPTPGRV